MSASYMMKNRGAEFENAHDYIHSLSEKLAAIERISQRILKDQTGLQNLNSVLWCIITSWMPQFQISCPNWTTGGLSSRYGPTRRINSKHHLQHLQRQSVTIMLHCKNWLTFSLSTLFFFFFTLFYVFAFFKDRVNWNRVLTTNSRVHSVHGSNQSGVAAQRCHSGWVRDDSGRTQAQEGRQRSGLL